MSNLNTDFGIDVLNALGIPVTQVTKVELIREAGDTTRLVMHRLITNDEMIAIGKVLGKQIDGL